MMSSNSKCLSSAAWWVASILIALVFAGPFVIMCAASFQPSRTYFTGAWDWLPTHPTLENYRIIFTRSSVIRWTWNSLVISTGPVVVSVGLAVLLGYIFARKPFPGRELFFWLLLGSMMAPFQATLIPLYLGMNRIGWIDTYWALIVPQLLSVTAVFVMRQFIQSIPGALEEAASLDGCGPWRTVFHVILPLSKTAVATLLAFGFINSWNAFLGPLVFTVSEAMRPLTVGLATFADTSGSFGLNMASAMINFVPTFLIFIALQRYFVSGVATGGMKL